VAPALPAERSRPDPMTEQPQDRHAGLLALKLGALARARWGEASEQSRAGTFPSGATLVDPVAGRLWVLIEEDAERRLGAVLAVARRDGVAEIHVVVDDPVAAGVLARRAAQFAVPPHIWRTEGLELHAATPAPPAPIDAPPPEAELYRPVLVAAGLEPVEEGGHLTGELLGLEVARVVTDPDGGSPARVEAGVGRFDREAGSMMHAHLGEADAVARVVGLVGRQRTAEAERHPLNQLVPERWLRAVLLARPEIVGASDLHPVGSALPRRNLTERGIATAVGVDIAGQPLVVTCSTGVELDLVPGAADDRLTHAPDARLVLAVPARDAVPVTRDLAASLARPAEVVAIDDAWRSLTAPAS